MVRLFQEILSILILSVNACSITSSLYRHKSLLNQMRDARKGRKRVVEVNEYGIVK